MEETIMNHLNPEQLLLMENLWKSLEEIRVYNKKNTLTQIELKPLYFGDDSRIEFAIRQ